MRAGHVSSRHLDYGIVKFRGSFNGSCKGLRFLLWHSATGLARLKQCAHLQVAGKQVEETNKAGPSPEQIATGQSSLALNKSSIKQLATPRAPSISRFQPRQNPQLDSTPKVSNYVAPSVQPCDEQRENLFLPACNHIICWICRCPCRQ